MQGFKDIISILNVVYDQVLRMPKRPITLAELNNVVLKGITTWPALKNTPNIAKVLKEGDKNTQTAMFRKISNFICTELATNSFIEVSDNNNITFLNRDQEGEESAVELTDENGTETAEVVEQEQEEQEEESDLDLLKPPIKTQPTQPTKPTAKVLTLPPANQISKPVVQPKTTKTPPPPKPVSNTTPPAKQIASKLIPAAKPTPKITPVSKPVAVVKPSVKKAPTPQPEPEPEPEENEDEPENEVEEEMAEEPTPPPKQVVTKQPPKPVAAVKPAIKKIPTKPEPQNEEIEMKEEPIPIKSQPPPQPGDWLCQCKANNFARRTHCFICGKPKPLTQQPLWNSEPDFSFPQQPMKRKADDELPKDAKERKLIELSSDPTPEELFRENRALLGENRALADELKGLYQTIAEKDYYIQQLQTSIIHAQNGKNSS